MTICRRCLYPHSHPLNLTIDDEGICSGCRVHEEKDELCWPDEFEKLRKLTDQFRSKSGMNYDCIVPVSGARDSFYMVHIVKNVLGMRPLLAYYNSHYNTDTGIRNLAYLRIAFACDMMGMNVAAPTAKAITRASLNSMGSMYWHILAGQTVWPVRMAIQFKIPLIIWGAHQGIDQVGMFSHRQKVEMTRKYRKEHDLMGYEIEDLVQANPELRDYNTEMFSYPLDEELEAVGVRGIYLNNYLRWDSRGQHELMIDKFGYESRRQHRTFDCYNDADSYHYNGLHDLIKFRKHGYGKVVDHASREIRLGQMTRQQAIELLEQYQGNNHSEDSARFLNWIGMGQDELDGIIDRHRNPKAWEKGSDGKWINKLYDIDALKRDLETDPIQMSSLEQSRDYTPFTQTVPRKADTEKEGYTVVGKGYLEESGPHVPVTIRDLPEKALAENKDGRPA